MLAQHGIVLALVAGCLVYLGRGFVRTLTAKRTQFGKCCATGCAGTNEPTERQQRGTERLVFLPVESLQRRRP
jgi:hypothetical protein